MKLIDNRCIYIRSKQGTGKTTFTNNYMKDKKFLYVSNRVAVLT